MQKKFISKNPIKEEVFDNPMYQPKAIPLAFLQRTNPHFEQNNEKKYKMRTLTLMGQSREQRVAAMQQVMQMM